MAFALLPELEDDDVDVDVEVDDEEDEVEDDSLDEEDVDVASLFLAVSLLPDFSALTLPERESFR
ncbi:hypothetical protein OWR29_43375 [Actinoplanes sp. Pm04-4]|uniref:Uncharacterized protein n=1 Tax=Paractinoplanes pyxinae TaxID=2997416 RepID=A0ABT4BH32_9ACTN|nr:hypothetical protein [Actinoplanes pyxinae]MCY1144883.1 hypothetical protein [Actinoplanes pyxinae]